MYSCIINMYIFLSYHHSSENILQYVLSPISPIYTVTYSQYDIHYIDTYTYLHHTVNEKC